LFWSIIVALAWLFVESIGLPLLSEGAFGTLGAAIYSRHIHPWPAFVIAYLSVVAGNAVGYAMFYAWGPALVQVMERKWPKLYRLFRVTEPYARKHSILAITVSRFVGWGTFGVVLWVVAMIRTPWYRFLPYLFLLNIPWTFMWLFGSTWLVKVVVRIFKPQTPWQVVLLIAVVIAVIWGVHLLIGKIKALVNKKAGSANE
jgi:membrane protein DedA with SNARE-associated domain